MISLSLSTADCYHEVQGIYFSYHGFHQFIEYIHHSRFIALFSCQGCFHHCHGTLQVRFCGAGIWGCRGAWLWSYCRGRGGPWPLRDRAGRRSWINGCGVSRHCLRTMLQQYNNNKFLLSLKIIMSGICEKLPLDLYIDRHKKLQASTNKTLIWILIRNEEHCFTICYLTVFATTIICMFIFCKIIILKF